jgi:hypothetical protein
MIDWTKLDSLEGWCFHEKMESMYNLIINTKPLSVVEIGVFGGKSLIPQAMALKENKLGKIYGIDSWNQNDCVNGMCSDEHIQWWSQINYEKIYQGCIASLKIHEVDDFVQIHRMTSEEYSYKIDYEIDILHIDGNHEEENSQKDVELYVDVWYYHQ